MIVYQRFEVYTPVFHGLGGVKKSLWTYVAKPCPENRRFGFAMYELFIIKNGEDRAYKISDCYISASRFMAESWLRKNYSKSKIKMLSMNFI